MIELRLNTYVSKVFHILNFINFKNTLYVKELKIFSLLLLQIFTCNDIIINKKEKYGSRFHSFF